VQTEYDEWGTLTVAYSIVRVPAPLNAMQDSCNTRELKRLLVITDLGTDYERKQQVSYYVENLQGRT
jgi:hypothetical protein